MGHYYSEMVSHEELEREEAARLKRLDERTAKIQEAIDKKGLARFLAELKISTWSNSISV